MSVFEEHLVFVKHLDAEIKQIMTDGKVLINDIPKLIALFTDLLLIKPSSQDTATALQLFYDYTMIHYNLFPNDVNELDAFKDMFATCVKLILFQATTATTGKKNFLQKLFSCFKKGKKEIITDILAEKDEIKMVQEQLLVDAVKEQVDAVNEQVDAVKEQVDAVNEQVDAVNEQVDAVKEQVLNEVNEQIVNALGDTEKIWDSVA